jgi:hypothetical protein
MEKITHSFTDLFKQLGLPHNQDAIEFFLTMHRPLNAATRVEDASFWNPSQRNFLEEQLSIDEDWARLIDQMSLALRDGGGRQCLHIR